MSDEPLFTLRELADQLSLPESTVRYYRDAFLDHIPSVGTGRRRRYPPAALAVLRSIASGYSAGRTRQEILRGVDAPAAKAAPADGAAAAAPKARRRPAAETAEVTNLDLLAAILDGEREQREALWQMAQEIVRLTEVLESQEKVLAEIGDHTGFTLQGAAPRPYLAAEPAAPPALGRGAEPAAPPTPAQTVPAPAGPAPVSAPPPPPAPQPAPAEAQASGPTAGMPAWLQDLAPPPEPRAGTAPLAETAPPPFAPPGEPSEIERLRRELDSERQIVERLREAKLKLEQRAAQAEDVAAEARSRRRGSVIGRLLGSDRPEP